MVSGSKKGSTQERKLCRVLSQWYTNGERDDIFWRSNSSGAQWTQSRKKGRQSFKTQAGDIAAIDPLGQPFTDAVCVEIKFYKDLQLRNMFYKQPSTLESFWETHQALSESVRRVPMLISKENNKPELVLLPSHIMERLGLRMRPSTVNNFSLYPLSNFLAEVTPESLLYVVTT
jgi:hypothetical protein